MTKYSSNKKTNAVLNCIEQQLQDLGIEEIKHYKQEFPNELDYNLVQYGCLLVYYEDIRQMYITAGYKAENWSNEKLWQSYKRQVRYIVNQLLKS